MAQFKDIRIDDKVVVNNSFTGAAKPGATGLIQQKNDLYSWIWVQWDEGDLRQGQNHGWYTPSGFDVVAPELPGEYIISVKKDGKYEPAQNPKVYVSDGQAHSVATKMATTYGGEFVVFKAISSVSLPPPPKVVVRKFA